MAAVAKAGRNLLSLGQKALYSQVFDVHVTGKNFIPQNRNFLVIANHTSHLDMGLVKTALGEQGEKLTALAAKDYFFDTPLKRAYFENFTQLIPMERKGSLRESLKMAQEALHQGYHLLIFPEGTRNTSGTLQEFKPTLGYLALTCNVDVLPLYIDGAQTVLPKGALFPKGRHLHVRIGPLLKIDDLRPRVQGMPKSDGYRFVTRLCEEAMKALLEKKVFSPPSTNEDKKTPLSGAGET
jgi:long-chain acyl-CoA synthetase